MFVIVNHYEHHFSYTAALACNPDQPYQVQLEAAMYTTGFTKNDISGGSLRNTV